MAAKPGEPIGAFDHIFTSAEFEKPSTCRDNGAEMNGTKAKKLAALARARKEDHYKDFRQVGSFHEGIYDQGDYVSPWTRGAHNLDSKLMVIGQDWLGVKKLAKPVNPLWVQQGQDPTLPTNRNLQGLNQIVRRCRWRRLKIRNTACA
jgi:hypothetical protein